MIFVCPHCGALNHLAETDEPRGCGCCGFYVELEEEIYDEMAFTPEKKSD
jgi:hypothetical protein